MKFHKAQFSVSANDLLQNSFAEFRAKYALGAKEFRQKMLEFLRKAGLQA